MANNKREKSCCCCSCCCRLCSKLSLALITVDLLCIFIIIYVGISQPVVQITTYLDANNYITIPCNTTNFTVHISYDCNLNCFSCVSTVGITGYQSCQQFTTPHSSPIYNSSQLQAAENYRSQLTGSQFYPCSDSCCISCADWCFAILSNNISYPCNCSCVHTGICYQTCIPVVVVSYSYILDFSNLTDSQLYVLRNFDPNWASNSILTSDNSTYTNSSSGHFAPVKVSKYIVPSGHYEISYQQPIDIDTLNHQPTPISCSFSLVNVEATLVPLQRWL